MSTLISKGKPRGRNGGRKAPYGPTERMYVATSLASIIKEKGTGWVLEVLRVELKERGE